MKISEIKNASIPKNILADSVNLDYLLTFSNEKQTNPNQIWTSEQQNKNLNIFYNKDTHESNDNQSPIQNIYYANKNVKNETFSKKLEKYNFQKDSFHKKNRILNDFSYNPFGNDSYNTNDLNKPLLSSSKNITKNSLTNDNFIINTSETKNDLNIYRNNNNEKIHDNIGLFNNAKISNAFVLEYEKSVVNCSNICAYTCTKSNFISLINVENEEISDGVSPNNQRINPNIFVSSSKSFLIFIITVIIAAFHFVLYRKLSSLIHYMYSNEYSDDSFGYLKYYLTRKNIMSDFNIFTWRFQMISFILFIYIFITNYLIKNNYTESLEGRLTILEDVRGKDFCKIRNNMEKKLHLIYLKYEDIINLDNIKNIGIICSSIYLLFFSSLFMPISMCLAVQYLTILIKFFHSMRLNFEIKTNNLFRIIVYILTILGIIMSLSNDSYSSSIFSKYNKLETEKGIIENQSSEPRSIPFFVNLLGIILSILSGLINVFFCQDINKHYLSSYSAFEYMVILNFNATIIMSFLNFVLNSYFGNPLYSIDWLFQYDNNLNMYILIFGIIAFLNIMFTIFSSVYLNNNYLKFVKIIEIPLADTIAISVFSLYKNTNEINYHVGLINFMIAIVLLEFSNLFIKRTHMRKYDF